MKRAINSMLLLFLPFVVAAQHTVAPCTGWLATVDEPTQQIVLSWHPSVDSGTMGYHICSGTPCLDYDTVFGRFDTTYICLDHSPLERHSYRLHVFDSSYNVSALTPPFGNMVLDAGVEDCAVEVSASWNAYTGMPGGTAHYTLLGLFEPMDSIYRMLYSTSDSTMLTYSFSLPEAATRVRLKVRAIDDLGYCSFSNVVDVERRTVDTAAVVGIVSATVDSAISTVRLRLAADSTYSGAPYVLYRKVNDGAWKKLDELYAPFSPLYIDPIVTPYDSLYCYILGVADACGLNERFSDTVCVVVPDPPQPAAFFPNVVLVGNAGNGTFHPVVRGLKGDYYELDIYSRMGQLVFHSNNPDEGWTPLPTVPQGVYTYSLRCRFNSNAVDHYVGTVTVIR